MIWWCLHFRKHPNTVHWCSFHFISSSWFYSLYFETCVVGFCSVSFFLRSLLLRWRFFLSRRSWTPSWAMCKGAEIRPSWSFQTYDLFVEQWNNSSFIYIYTYTYSYIYIYIYIYIYTYNIMWLTVIFSVAHHLLVGMHIQWWLAQFPWMHWVDIGDPMMGWLYTVDDQAHLRI
jgi:hypothetical protein